MGRVSIFIDAGYLFKQGSGAALNAKLGRHAVVLDAKRFMEELGTWVCGCYLGDELLRTYWYDGARQGVPTPEQLDVAALSFVKLRLGRINSAGLQKGVDTLIVRDLMVLSQERSIHRAVVLSGDEDLREGIEYAQDRGVRVAVAGIDVNGNRNQSVELVRGADESLVVPTAILTNTLTRKSPTVAVTSATALVVAPLAVTPASSGHVSSTACAAEAAKFAQDWLAKAAANEIAAIVADRPRIPHALDALMLQHAVKATGLFTIDDRERRDMRAAFWVVIDIATTTVVPTT